MGSNVMGRSSPLACPPPGRVGPRPAAPGAWPSGTLPAVLSGSRSSPAGARSDRKRPLGFFGLPYQKRLYSQCGFRLVAMD